MSIPRVPQPLGKPAPYVVPVNEGESMTIPGSKATVRILASAKETDRLISVFRFDGVTGDPVGFHYHNYAHDIFMCTKGLQKVWAGDKCKILSPGDFCSVPPKVVHNPQMLGPICETIGLVAPGDWIDFFRFISDKYDGVFANEFDDRNPMASLAPKFQTIKEKYDVIFQPQYVGAELSDWSDDDQKLPESTEAYYLKSNTGPRYLLGGVLSRPFITTKQSDGKFAITSIESSNRHSPSVLAKPFTFATTHQVYCVLDGAVTITVDEKHNEVRAGETVFIPAGQKMSIEFTDRFVRFWSFTSGDGLETFISQAGVAYGGLVVPDKTQKVDVDKVTSTARNIGMEFEP